MANSLTNAQVQQLIAVRPDLAQYYANGDPANKKEYKTLEAAVSHWWDKIGLAEYGSFENALNAPSQQADEQARMDAVNQRAPDELKNDPNWQSLPLDMKEVALYNYEITLANDATKAAALASALEQATAQADPYWKQIIRVAQDGILRSFEEAQGDFQSALAREQRRIEEINQDLASNKAYLSLTEQQTLASIAGDLQDAQDSYNRNKQFYDAETAAQLTRMETEFNKQKEDITRNKEYLTAEEKARLDSIEKEYNINKGNVINAAAQSGLTFSTKRDIAMERLRQDEAGVVESTRRQFGNQIQALNSDLAYAEQIKQLTQGDVQRQNAMRQSEILAGMQTAQRKSEEAKSATEAEYAKQIADLEVEAARGNTEAQAQIADLQRKLGESVTSIGRSAESYLGTEGVPNLPGYEAMGDITGTIYEEQKKDIEERKDAIYQELTTPSLKI